MRKLSVGLWCAQVALALILQVNSSASEKNLAWDSKGSQVSADFQSEDLLKVLGQIAAGSGWQIYYEPGISRPVSAKFKDLAPGEALRLLLGNLNFALVPETNAPARLYVFQTTKGKATRLIRSAAGKSGRDLKRIPNQLIVRLRPGARIEDLARLLGAKITGRIDALNTYRLEFPDEAAAETARESLLNNPDVTAVDSNYAVDRPPTPEALANGVGPDWNLKPKDQSGPCGVTIGLIDTMVAPGNGLDPFLLTPISVPGAANSPDAGLTHGTAMAQAIMQSVQTNSIANKTSVKILPVDVYGANASTTTFDVGQGIYQAINGGANIINMSLGGGGDSPFLHSLITSASKQGVVFFGAAGNEPVTTPVYPAAYPEVIAVTASDSSGQVASYANRGSFVSIMEPGTSIADFQGQVYLVTGTSTATALASGYAAGLADSSQNCPDKVVSTIRSKLGVKFSP